MQERAAARLAEVKADSEAAVEYAEACRQTAYFLGLRVKDAERLSKSFGGATQETLIGQASTDLSQRQAESNVAEFGPTQSIERASRDMLDEEAQELELRLQAEVVLAADEVNERP